MLLRGIRGSCRLSDVDRTAMALLLAGELLHIGKNTSFGFGRYTVKNVREE
jgi:CRISPR/Cas system endoribonuclease Cas6 (RAMP superfamily)